MLAEESLLVRDDRRGMRQIGKVTQSHNRRHSSTRRLRVTTTSRHAQRCPHSSDHQDDTSNRSGHHCLHISRTAAGSVFSVPANSYVISRLLEKRGYSIARY